MPGAREDTARWGAGGGPLGELLPRPPRPAPLHEGNGNPSPDQDPDAKAPATAQNGGPPSVHQHLRGPAGRGVHTGPRPGSEGGTGGGDPQKPGGASRRQRRSPRTENAGTCRGARRSAEGTSGVTGVVTRHGLHLGEAGLGPREPSADPGAGAAVANTGPSVRPPLSPLDFRSRASRCCKQTRAGDCGPLTGAPTPPPQPPAPLRCPRTQDQGRKRRTGPL